MPNWKKHKRKGGMSTDRVAIVSLRPTGLAFNAQFVAQGRLDQYNRVSVFVDATSFKLGLKFHGDASDQDSYALCRDGGGRGMGRMAQTQTLIREHSWIGALAKMKDTKVRRFKPEWESYDGLWVINMCPSFEVKVSHKSEIPSDATGIYRYVKGSEIVYIGRGTIRSRLASPERKEWDFDVIEYSLVSDISNQEKWEAYWLDVFVSENEKLPLYNRIGGKKA